MNNKVYEYLSEIRETSDIYDIHSPTSIQASDRLRKVSFSTVTPKSRIMNSLDKKERETPLILKQYTKPRTIGAAHSFNQTPVRS